MVFFSDEANQAEDASDMILELHVSRFVTTAEDFEGFIEHHGGEEDPFVQRFMTPHFIRRQGQEENAI